jgi:hypothetical protein
MMFLPGHTCVDQPTLSCPACTRAELVKADAGRGVKTWFAIYPDGTHRGPFRSRDDAEWARPKTCDERGSTVADAELEIPLAA